MSVCGPLSHIDLPVSDPGRSIPFYAVFFEALGFTRFRSNHPEFAGERPRRAAWFIRHPCRAIFGIEVRPAVAESSSNAHDRHAPGLHHMAFHADSRQAVNEVHVRVVGAGGTVLDPPTDYSGREGYSDCRECTNSI
ncbi:MAG: VOC family protein [Candidatus Binatia bacterium]